VMSIVRNLESSDLDIIAIFIRTASSCICSMSGGGPGHRSDCQRHRVFNFQLAMMSRHMTM
jgi:hypothetical protein